MALKDIPILNWISSAWCYILHGGPERSRQSNLAVFTVEGGLDSKFSYVK